MEFIWFSWGFRGFWSPRGSPRGSPEAAPEVLFQDLREFPNLHQLVFVRIPEQNSIENLRIQLDQELQVREEIVSDISILRIETEFQRRLIIQLESLENERQIIQDLLQP